MPRSSSTPPRSSRNPSGLTLGDFFAMGQEDCDDSIEHDDFEDGIRKALPAREIVADYWKDAEASGSREVWFEQSTNFLADARPGLTPEACYQQWALGWQDRARSWVDRWKKEAAEGAARYERNPSRGARKNPRLTLGDEVIEGMARALWVTSYADWVEGSAPKAWRDKMKPGGRGDWNRVAPATPESAYQAAQQLVARVEKANGYTIPALVELAAFADEVRASDRFADAFGHALAMQALGTGVTWFDDHARFLVVIQDDRGATIQHPLKVPHVEAWSSDGQTLEWSPQATTNPARKAPLSGDDRRRIIQAARDAEANLAAIARTRRPTAQETAQARRAYAAAAAVQRGER